MSSERQYFILSKRTFSLNKFLFLFTSMFFIFITFSYSQVKLPKLVSDGMILQRNTPVNLWGWATPGEKITLSVDGQTYETSTKTDGKWLISLPAHEAGGPFIIDINASNHNEIKNVLFGDVWLCSGQSNMEYPFSRLKDRYAEEIANCTNSSIRQFKVPLIYNFEGPQEDYAEGSWVEVNPQSILNFSAVAYFFVKELHEKYDVPVGIINASLGGSPAEAWMSTDALKEFPNSLEEAKKYADKDFVKKLKESEQKAIDDWYITLDKTDKGLLSKPNWKDPDLDHSFWQEMPVPDNWINYGLGMVNGAIWFRKEFIAPASMAGKPMRLFMGRIVDADSVFINNSFIGTTSYQYPQRDYHVPENVIKEGKNIIIVRVISNMGPGGFVKEKPYMLFTDKDTVDLKGNWHFKLGCKMPPTPGSTFVQWKPTGLYNSMIAPSNNFVIKGAAWYQGESNAGKPNEYQQLLTSLITDWRTKRNQENLPFIIAQLPNFMKASDEPEESDWASFRNAQLKTALSVKNTAISVNIDLGDWNDIHPQNKSAVGKRLALAAENLAYGDKDVVGSGPMLESVEIKGNKVWLTFSETGTGLLTNDGTELKCFAIAGEDNKFVWAKAYIECNKVVVCNDTIKKPVTVRYAWANNPKGANLFNAEGLPASPFTSKNVE